MARRCSVTKRRLGSIRPVGCVMTRQTPAVATPVNLNRVVLAQGLREARRDLGVGIGERRPARAQPRRRRTTARRAHKSWHPVACEQPRTASSGSWPSDGRRAIIGPQAGRTTRGIVRDLRAFRAFWARVAAEARPNIKWVWNSAGDDLCCALQSKRAVVADGLGFAETRSSGSHDLHGAIACEASRGAFERSDERVGADKPRLGDLVQRPNDDGVELRSDGRVHALGGVGRSRTCPRSTVAIVSPSNGTRPVRTRRG